MLQPVQVLLAVVEVVLEGAVAVVAEVTLPHGHPRRVLPLPLPGKSQSAGSERRGNATTLPEHAPGARPAPRQEGSTYPHQLV